MAGKYKPISKTLKRNPEILTLVNPSKPKLKTKKRVTRTPAQTGGRPVAKKRRRVYKRNVRQPWYQDPNTGKRISQREADIRKILPKGYRDVKPLETAFDPKPLTKRGRSNTEYNKRQAAAVTPAQVNSAIATVAAKLGTTPAKVAAAAGLKAPAKKRTRAKKSLPPINFPLAATPKAPAKRKKLSTREKTARLRARRVAKLLPFGSPIPKRPRKKAAIKRRYVRGVSRKTAALNAVKRVPGYYAIREGKLAPAWAYHKNPKRRLKRTAKGQFARRSYRRNANWQAMVKPILAGGSGFFLSRVVANMANLHVDKLPEKLVPYAGQLSSGAMLAAAIFVPLKVKALAPYHTPLVIGTGIAFLEQMIAKFAPATVMDRVAPPIAAMAPLAGDLDMYEAALSGSPYDRGVGSYLPASAASNLSSYVDTGVGEYMSASQADDMQELGSYVEDIDDSDLSGGIFGPEADINDYGDDRSGGREDLGRDRRGGIFGGSVFG